MENTAIVQARGELLKKLNVMVRKIEEITTFVLIGEKDCPPADVHLIAAGNDGNLEKIYADLHFLIGEFLAPQTSNREQEDGRTVCAYRFDDGLFLRLILCAEDNLPSCGWWLPYLDKHGAAEDFYLSEDKVDEDPARELPTDVPEDAPEAPSEPLPVMLPPAEDDESEIVTDLPAENEDEPSPDVLPEDAPEEAPLPAAPVLTWEEVYEKINLAKHAIAGGSLIYASELMNELRAVLVKLICEKDGVTENYFHSIDLLSGEETAALRKTYPARLESGAMVTALAAELTLFEKLLH